MNGAEAIVKCLELEGVKVVYGYPGVAICPFFNAITDSPIETVLVRTEQSAAHAASGMARSGGIGVCAVTSGPGATNLITGIATAFADSIPLICITGQVVSSLLGSDVFQEADITGAAESFVKYSYLVKDAADIPRIMKEAFYIANTGRKGPVLIDIPMDIQNAAIKNFKYPEEINLRTYKPTVSGNSLQIKRMLTALEKADKPLMCVGGGVLLGNAKDEIAAFSKKHQIPVVSTMMGIGVLPTADPLYFGMVGNNGKPYANRAMNEADLLIMVGARVADRAVNQPEVITRGKVLIHIDVDPAEIGKNAGPTIPIVGEAKNIFAELLKAEFESQHSAWLNSLSYYKEQMEPQRAEHPGFVDPARFIALLSEKMEEDAIYVADVGQNQIWSCAYHEVKSGRFLTSGGMGTMGYSIPAAVGAKKQNMDKQVIAVCGDGSFQMSMCELATIVQHNIPVKIIVMKNGYLGMVREYQQFTYKENYSVVDLSGSPDLVKLASAYDIPCIRLNDMENAPDAIDRFLACESAIIMECNVDPRDIVRYMA